MGRKNSRSPFYKLRDPLFQLRLSIVHCIFSGVRTHAKLIHKGYREMSERAYFLVGRSYLQTGSRAVCSSCEPSYILPGDVFQFGRRYCLCYFIWISLLLLPLSFLSFSFASSGLLLGDVDPTKDCAWVAQGLRGGIREARRRLVRCGTLSLKYPEVFFPRNCRSPSFLGSLNGPGYPGRIEKLPLCSIPLSLSLPLSLFFQSVSLALVPFFLRFCSRSNLYAPPPRKQPPITRRR